MRHLAAEGALRTVRLSNCGLDPELLREIAVGLCSSAVETLDLSGNDRFMDAGHAWVAAGVAHNRSVTKLSLLDTQRVDSDEAQQVWAYVMRGREEPPSALLE